MFSSLCSIFCLDDEEMSLLQIICTFLLLMVLMLQDFFHGDVRDFFFSEIGVFIV